MLIWSLEIKLLPRIFEFPLPVADAPALVRVDPELMLRLPEEIRFEEATLLVVLVILSSSPLLTKSIPTEE